MDDEIVVFLNGIYPYRNEVNDSKDNEIFLYGFILPFPFFQNHDLTLMDYQPVLLRIPHIEKEIIENGIKYFFLYIPYDSIIHVTSLKNDCFFLENFYKIQTFFNYNHILTNRIIDFNLCPYKQLKNVVKEIKTCKKYKLNRNLINKEIYKNIEIAIYHLSSLKKWISYVFIPSINDINNKKDKIRLDVWKLPFEFHTFHYFKYSKSKINYNKNVQIQTAIQIIPLNVYKKLLFFEMIIYLSTNPIQMKEILYFDKNEKLFDIYVPVTITARIVINSMYYSKNKLFILDERNGQSFYIVINDEIKFNKLLFQSAKLVTFFDLQLITSKKKYKSILKMTSQSSFIIHEKHNIDVSIHYSHEEKLPSIIKKYLPPTYIINLYKYILNNNENMIDRRLYTFNCSIVFLSFFKLRLCCTICRVVKEKCICIINDSKSTTSIFTITALLKCVVDDGTAQVEIFAQNNMAWDMLHINDESRKTFENFIRDNNMVFDYTPTVESTFVEIETEPNERMQDNHKVDELSAMMNRLKNHIRDQLQHRKQIKIYARRFWKSTKETNNKYNLSALRFCEIHEMTYTNPIIHMEVEAIEKYSFVKREISKMILSLEFEKLYK